jgi:hypothetical protein
VLSVLFRRLANRYVFAKRVNAVGKDFSRKLQQFFVCLKVRNGHSDPLPIESHQFAKRPCPSNFHMIRERPSRASSDFNPAADFTARRPVSASYPAQLPPK